MFSLMKGVLRGSLDTARALAVGGQGQLFTSQLLPPLAQLVAEGRVWRAQEASATASVVALPTTASLFTLGNNESDDGNWYVLLAIYAQEVANAAAIDRWSLAVCLSQLPDPAGGMDTTLAQDIAKTSIKGLLGARQGGYNGRAILDTGVTLDTDDLWFPLGTSGTTAVASATGGSAFLWLNGLIVMPPKCLLGTASLATSTSCTTRKGLIWAEVPRSWLQGV